MKYPGRAGILLALASLLLPATAAAEAPQVVTEEVTEQPVIEEIRANGSVVALRHAALSPAVAGQVAELAVDSGDRVETGKTLLTLDPEIASAELRAAEAAAAEAEETLADARRRLSEARELGPSEGISESEIRSREAEVRIAERALERLRATAAGHRARLDRHSLKAPFDGVIGRRQTDPGEWVTPGTEVLELVATNRLRVDFRVSQRYFPRLSPETELDVRFNGLPGQSFPAQIRAIVPVNDPQARTFVVRTELEETDLTLIPGMSASATLRLDTGRVSPVIPRDALIRHPEGRTTAWTVSREDGEYRAREHRVETGLVFGDWVEIRQGLEAGATVVTRGNERLQLGQKVRLSGNREN